MSQEQRDSYVIPPNFIEGGSFFGGLFKARNVVEAVILAAGTGLPILTLSLTLTVRIILLCLTSLPLALLALIGIAGMPLSSYIILFFRFLRNRRTLSKSGGKSSRKQSILPTWDKKSGPSTAVQPAAYKKDGSRIRFAKDTRRLMLDTAYRQKKQAERPGNPLAAYVPIQKIENGIVYTTDHRFIKILEIVPINFLLRSAREQRNIVYSFISYLKIACEASHHGHHQARRYEPAYRNRAPGDGAGDERKLPDAAGGLSEAAQKARLQRSHRTQVFPHHGI